jgi:hypothetical protein
LKRRRDEDGERQNPEVSQAFDFPGGLQLSPELLGLVRQIVQKAVRQKVQQLDEPVIQALQSPGFDFGVPFTSPTASLSSQGSGQHSLFGSQQSTPPSQEYYVAQTPPTQDDVDMEVYTTPEKPEKPEREHGDKSVVGKMEETPTEVREVPEVREVEEAEEIQLDDETAMYISQQAEEIYDQALKELIDGMIEEAKGELSQIGDYPLALLRLDILADPAIKSELDKDKDAKLDALRVEIWRLLQEDGD